MYSVSIETSERRWNPSELFRPQHRVHEVYERRDAQQQRNQCHDVTYTRSQSVMNASIEANAANPRTIIPSNTACPFAPLRSGHPQIRKSLLRTALKVPQEFLKVADSARVEKKLHNPRRLLRA
jgi:hypothetical protein